MSFNLLIDSKKNTQIPNPLIIDPSLNYFYTFNNSDLEGNVLRNQGVSQAFDLTINAGVVNGSFNGSALDGVIPASITLPSTYTIGFWASFNSFNQIVFAFGITDNYANGVSVWYDTTGVLRGRDDVSNNNGGNQLISSIPRFTLAHIVWVNRGGNTWFFYKDGVLVNTYTSKLNNSASVKNVNSIGRGIPSSPLKMNGLLDGFFVYQGELTAAQILEVYQKGQQPTQTNYYYTIPIQPYTYTYANNQLNYWFDFYARPPHPYGGNRYRVYSSFISIAITPTTIIRTNQMAYYIIDGLGFVNNQIGRGVTNLSMRTNHLIKNITLKRSTNFVGSQYNQKWIDLDPLMPITIDDLNDTGILRVEIRLIQSNVLSGNVNTWGAQANNYLISLLFEPIEG